MGSANPRLLKTLLSWLRRSVGIPLTLLVLYLEVYPSSVILHRLSRRLRRSSFSFACILKKRDHANLSDQNDNNDIFFVGGADVMDRAQSHSRSQHKPTSKTHSRKRPLTLNHRAGSGGSPISYRPQQPLASASPTSPSPTTTPTTSATTNSAIVATTVTTPAVARATDTSPPVSAPTSPSPTTTTTTSTSSTSSATTNTATIATSVTTPAIARAADASPPASGPLANPQPLHRPSPSTVPSTTTTPAIARAANASPPASAALSSPKPLQRPSASTVPSTPTPTTMRSHTRSMSHADVTKQGKRLSLQFPIQPSAGSNSPVFSPRSRPQSWVAAPSPSHSADNSGLNTPSSPETNILAILAAQERYVMELKEELAKAEGDLKILKTHYATHQAMKQRNEGRKITQLQPLNTSLANFQEEADHDDDGSTLWMQREMERRKALLNSTKSSQRKTFSGSRHLRTLSLLSPDKSYTPSFPQPLDIRGDNSTNIDNNNDKTNNTQLVPPLIRHATSPDIASHIASLPNNERYDLGGLPNIQRDAILRTGKQMATDLRDGLMTFIEDIRQATVGEEAINDNSAHGGARGPAVKTGRKPSDGRPTLSRGTSSKKSTTQKTGDIGDDFWKEHGLSEPTAVPTNKKTHPLKNIHTPQKQSQTNPDDFEDWANWDTPNDKYLANNSEINNGSSSDESDAPSSPVSGPSSSRTSTSSVGNIDEITSRDQKRSSIPWPDLVKLSPNNLKRTASHLMKEWEKQLTPPPEARDASHSSGDYVGRSASPVP